MDFDDLLGEQLSTIADDAAPVGSFDPHRAIGQAQRIRLRRRTAGAGTTLAVLGLATGLGLTLTGGGAAIAPAASSGMGLASSASSASSASPTEHRSARGADPLTVEAYFGKLASPLVATGVSVSDSGLQQLEVTDESTGTVFTVTLGDSGFAPAPEMGYPRAPDVNGDTAYWDEAGSLGHLSGVPDGLSWQYSPNGWADLTFDQPAASRSELEEIADAVHSGSTAVRMPIGLPAAAGFTLGKAASLTFNADGSLEQATITLTAPASTSTLAITVYPAGGAVAKCAFPPTGTASSPETTTFLGEDCNGLYVDAYLNSHDPATVAAAASLLNGAVWYGIDPVGWTDNVYR
jgi:hypothetical protein